MILAALLVSAAFALNASDIPRANTDKDGDLCGTDEMPPMVLDSCTEELDLGVCGEACDIRGTWVGLKNGVFHWERHEQCGNRLTAVSYKPGLDSHSFVIHDTLKMDGTMDADSAMDDWKVSALPMCDRLNVGGYYGEEGGCVHYFSNAPNMLVSRCRSGETMTWTVEIMNSQDVVIASSTVELQRTTLSFEEAKAALMAEEEEEETGFVLTEQNVGMYLNAAKNFFTAALQSLMGNASQGMIQSLQTILATLTMATGPAATTAFQLQIATNIQAGQWFSFDP